MALLTLLACGDESGGDDVSPAGDAAPEGEDDAATNEAEGDAGEPDSGPSHLPETPEIDLEGAVSGTIENVTASASWSMSSELTSIIHLPAGGTPLRAGFTFMFKGVPMAGKTYDQATDELSCALTVTRGSDNATWAAAHAIAREMDQGSCSLSLREVEESLDTGSLKQYTVHGSVEGTLPAESSSAAEGSVTMHAAF